MLNILLILYHFYFHTIIKIVYLGLALEFSIHGQIEKELTKHSVTPTEICDNFLTNIIWIWPEKLDYFFFIKKKKNCFYTKENRRITSSYSFGITIVAQMVGGSSSVGKFDFRFQSGFLYTPLIRWETTKNCSILVKRVLGG